MAEREDKYWICSDCAKQRSWKCDSQFVTMIMGFCGYCSIPYEVPLTPTRDFKKPPTPNEGNVK